MLTFKQRAPEIIKSKVCAYEYPLDDMVIYSTQKSKYFSKESDIILLCLTNQLGYGKWRDIKKAIRRDARCRFDHLFLSRNEAELQRRVDILVKALEKEEESNQKKPQKELNEDDIELVEDMPEDPSEESKSIMISTLTKKINKQRMVKKDETESERSSSIATTGEDKRFEHLKDEVLCKFGRNLNDLSNDEELK